MRGTINIQHTRITHSGILQIEKSSAVKLRADSLNALRGVQFGKQCSDILLVL
jgi:hypothetical protein